MPKVAIEVSAYQYLWNIAVNACKVIDTDDPVGLLDDHYGAYLPNPNTDICHHCGHEVIDMNKEATCPRCGKDWSENKC